MKNTYRKVDLGKPKLHSRLFGLAYIHTPTESLFVKGGVDEIQHHLSRERLPFFGKIRIYNPNHNKVTGTQVISGNGLRVAANRRFHNGRLIGYKFTNDKYGITLKKVRRFPTRWLQELNILLEVDSHVLAAVDYLLDNGFEFSAEVLRNSYYAAQDRHVHQYGFD